MKQTLLLFPLLLTPALVGQRILEVEPNDTPATAQPLTFGVHVLANLAAGTQDWYTFTVATPSEVHLQTSGNFAVSSTVDTCVLIYDAAGTTRLAWNDNQRGSHSDAGVTLAPGIYTALVMGKTGTVAGDYGLDLLAYPAAVVNTVEGAEPNGDPGLGETPTPITLGDTFTGFLATPTDEDWFSFTVTQRCVVQAVVVDDGGVPQLDTTSIAFRQETSPGVWAALGTANSSTVSHRALTLAHPTVLAPGNYALRIAAGTATATTPPIDYVKTGNYGVRTVVISMPGTTVVAEAAEPNNTPTTAAMLTLGDMAVGNCSGSNESDWYGFFVTTPTTVAFMSDNGSPTPLTDTTVRLWDETGTTTLASGSTGGPSSHGRVIFTITQPGFYYIDVAGGVFAATGDYVLYTGGATPHSVSASFTQRPPSTNACPGSNGLRPALAVANGEIPQLGSHFYMRLANALPNAFLLAGLGFSQTTAAGGTIPLPIDMTFLGGPGCFLRVDPELQYFGLADASGIWFWDLPVPLDNTFLGVNAYAQALLQDLPNNPGGFSMTNDVRLILGNRGF